MLSKFQNKWLLTGLISAALPLMVAGSATAEPPWAGDNCPPQVSNAFNSSKADEQCAAVIVLLKSGATEVCGCKERGVSKFSSVDDKIPREHQWTAPTIDISVTKTGDSRDPKDPCKTIVIGGVPIVYCW